MANSDGIQPMSKLGATAQPTGSTDAITSAGMPKRSRIRRHPERAVPEMAEEILLRGHVAHVGFAVDGQPYVLPMTYHYEDDTVYVHGAPASRMIKALRAGVPVCVEVTLLDGLVALRDAANHSMNYRSVMVFGVATPVTDLEIKRGVMKRMTLRYFSGRVAGQDYLPAREVDLRGVELFAITIEEQSAKSRSGGPMGPHDADEAGPGTRFVVTMPGMDG